MSDYDTAARFWAKISDEGRTYHPLIAHGADVAAVFEALTAPGTALFARIVAAGGVADDDFDRLRAALIYLAALHDLGKTNHGFQDKNGPWARPTRRWPATGHVVPVIASMEAGGGFGRAVLAILELLPLHRPDAVEALRTAIAHHGRPWVRDPRRRPRGVWSKVWSPDADSGRDPLREIGRLSEHALEWSHLSHLGSIDDDPLPWTPALSNLFAGLLTVSDWIGSTERIFGPAPEADDDPDLYWSDTRAKATRAVRQIGVRPSEVMPVDGQDVYSRLFPAVFPEHEPTVLQKLVAEMPLPTPGSRLVVESETGSGKTEAVLGLYARLRAAGRVDGLVFALPTRATAKAMYDRILASLPRLHPSGSVPPLALAMGGATNEASAPPEVTLDPELYPDPEDRDEHLWASGSHKKFFAAEIVVGTVDQVLLAGLPVKHAHMRHALLTRQFVVVDEIHSYDRYMNAVLNRVLDHHTALGGVVAFLSATLSLEARDGLVGCETEGQLDEAIAAPYPALSVFEPRAGGWTQTRAQTTARPKPVSWRLASQEASGDAFFDEAIGVAQAGGRVCILRNTVREARATVERLLELAPELLWRPDGSEMTPAYHSRFISGDRTYIDASALRDFGKGSMRAGVILVSTQVIEQSLDVDFDFMVTDLAPVDVLLQRIGRLHRHDRPQRPTVAAAPRIVIQAPAEAFPPRKELRNQGFGWGPVYGEVSDLELTRRLIRSMPEIVIPRDNRFLVEQVYHPESREALADESEEWSGAVQSADGRRMALDTAGVMSALDFGSTYVMQHARYDAAGDERIRTRIGDDRISVALDEPVRGWYDRSAFAEDVSLRLTQLQRAGGVDLSEPAGRLETDTDRGPIYRVGDELTVRYGPEGWVVEG